MEFVKMHGAGNDFVVLDGSGEDRDWASLAVSMCDRHFGIGSDGIILALPSGRCDLRMRMFNPDGSEAEMCGNGIRCLTRYAVERRLARPHDGAITIETLAGDLRCELLGNRGEIERVRVAMGRPRLEPVEIPVVAAGLGPILNHSIDIDGTTYAVTCVSMGNPHAVHFTDIPVQDFRLDLAGPKVEHHADFPKRVNFEIVNVIDRTTVEARVWERGAGLTLACGTGACAIGVALYLTGRSDGLTNIRLPGGELQVEWDGEGDVFLSGPAVEVFRGNWLMNPKTALAATSEGRL